MTNPELFTPDSFKLMRKVGKTERYINQLTESLNQTVFGQEEASEAVARAVMRHESGLSDPRRPLSSLFFMGPTGVGKTEMAYALSDHLFGTRDKVTVINCAELADKHTIYRIIGSPPGFIGYGHGLLISPDKLYDRNIIVFDEIEKAHTQVYRLLLSILDKGEITARVATPTAAQEVQLNFTNSYIFFTSNVGAEDIARLQKNGLGFVPTSMEQNLESVAKKALGQHFIGIPEFLGRMDEIIVFKPLHEKEYRQIFQKYIRQINEDAHARNEHASFLATTPECEAFIIQHTTQHNLYGARDIRNSIKIFLQQPLTDAIMSGEIQMGEPVVAVVEDGGIVFYTTEFHEKAIQKPNPIDFTIDLPPDDPPGSAYTSPPYTL